MKSLFATLAIALTLSGAAPPSSKQPIRSYDLTAIDRELRAQCADGRFSGVVLIQAGARRLYEHACGMADPVNGVPNRRDTRFKIYSVSKFLTALAVMRLVELKQLDLDASVTKYVVDAPPAWHPVTLRMLMNHTSGVPDLTDLIVTNFKSTPQAALRETLADLPSNRASLDTPPGTTFAYNNFGFELLANAAENVAGRPFSEVLDMLVFKPAGMKSASIEPPKVIMGHPSTVTERGMAIGFNGSPGALEQATNFAFIQLGAGAVRASVDDFVALDAALSAGRIISRSSLATMKRDPIADPAGPTTRQFGLGIIVSPVGDVAREGHTGGTNGYISDFERFPDDGVTMIALSNRGFTATRWLRDGLAQSVRAAR